MSLEYTNISHESLLADWNNRVLADEKYKNLSKASIYSYMQEFIAGVFDMTNYYIQRTAEENYLDTAKLDSSSIKLSHNLGYQPKRAIPATGNVTLELRGPLPANLKADDVIWLNNESLSFSFNNHDFMLDACYSYKLTAEDIAQGTSSSWSKRITYAVNGYESQRDGYIALDGKKTVSYGTKLHPIRVLQGKKVTKIIDPVTNSSQVGMAYQEYDIDDLSFSNWYGKRDPFAYVNGQYDKKYGICKIGIGKSLESAFSEENLYEIEDEAVELNSTGAWNVVCLKSNWDKTVRLYFGNGVSSSSGLVSIDDQIYVQYVVTDGSDANYPDALESELQMSGRVYASSPGKTYDVTSNVRFIFTGPVHGGTDFESRESMNRNAKLYYASSGKLITLPDYMSYLLTITDPITVKHAIAFGENQLEAAGIEHSSALSNLVIYNVFSDIYRESEGRYRPLNVFDEDEDVTGASLYYDYETYMAHLLDMTEFILAPKKSVEAQYGDHTTFGRWCAQIRSDASDRMMMNSKLVSMPPLFHYYDVVGDVQVDRHVDMAEYQAELENSIYRWLSENTTFKTPIFKSDIVNKILENPSSKRVNIDIKVSEWIKGEEHTYRFEPGTVSKSINILTLPANDLNGNDMRSILQEMVGKDVLLTIHDDGEGSAERFRIEDVSFDADHVYCTLNVEPGDVSDSYVDLTFDSTSLYSKGNLTGIDYDFMIAVQRWINSHTTVIGTNDRPIPLPYTVDFGIGDLPENLRGFAEELSCDEALLEMLQNGHIASISGTTRQSLILVLKNSINLLKLLLKGKLEYYQKDIVRNETMERMGANNVDISLNLSEEAFNYFLADAVKAGKVTWDTVKSDFPYIYPALKVVFDDNILDDNNNIVNFSSDRDIPVVRLRLRYKYA